MLEDKKEELAVIARKADEEGLCKHKSGNFSIKDMSTGYILITPSGVDRKNLTGNDICVLDSEMNVIENKKNYKPSSEVLMHIYAYNSREDVTAVVHTHSRFATSFAVLKKEIPPIVYEAVYYGGTVHVAPYGRPGTKELAQSIVEPLKKSDACLLESHGVITVGENIENTYLKAKYVEEIAEIYYRTLLLNGCKEPNVLPKEELKKWKYPSYVKLNKNKNTK
ncbi:class II aldolase/adducin family protein [Clostridium luticellarii]|jgi:L-fuculose-phosphate aldolase|uniref:L-fuculose phosphate aldolase n=1 Tax=Clostridium luticellarii TaxID=1691940 RepID=A0A2T0BC01_9CLOT|nr:class II aldolase/adducin family protein [Clostridium luticellarii]MCI1946225.1 class II aldolase/adducin family protein [Clostridium luticellarii]MCI1969524.1 class II aldolase/adducin family protein [Clostridium luticellarii]MCI1996718.1 class II aldolase/adducin family protein [Clostridium luticellarii]MCI2041006.1 class II aldolase/adducin family protein [Clostridium luticellarii]PRR81430.1 L-fuculose phosphate aldolase [Clostridium luticellarii]